MAEDPSQPSMAAGASGGSVDPQESPTPEQRALAAQASMLLSTMNPIQLQLLSNPDLAAKMLSPAGMDAGSATDFGASCTVYVGNLNPSITSEQLTQVGMPFPLP